MTAIQQVFSVPDNNPTGLLPQIRGDFIIIFIILDIYNNYKT